MYYKLFGCSHQWKKESDTTLPSAYEQSRAGKQNLSESTARIPYWAFAKTHILVLVCTQCGKIDKTVTKSEVY